MASEIELTDSHREDLNDSGMVQIMTEETAGGNVINAPIHVANHDPNPLSY